MTTSNNHYEIYEAKTEKDAPYILVLPGVAGGVWLYGDLAKKLAKQLHDAWLLTYENCGHLHFVEYEDTHEPILDFLKGDDVGEKVEQSDTPVTSSIDYMIDSIMKGSP